MPAPPRTLHVALSLALAGCGGLPVVQVPNVVQPYRIVIQQGNYITKEMVDQLKPGMSKEQVRVVLGTPLLTDIFHADRWDYAYYREAPGAKREQRNLSVIFEGGKLARVIGDLLPSEPAQAARKPAPAKPPAEAPKPAPAAAQAPAPAAEQNWRAESDSAAPSGAAKPAAAAAEKADEKKPEEKPEEKSERGFFGRILEKIGF